MFVQVTKSRRGDKIYLTYLVRESFRTVAGPRSRTVCNITALPPPVRQLITDSLAGQRFVAAEKIALQQALDYGGLAVLVEAWQQLGLDRLFARIGSPRQRALLQAMIFARLLFPCAKLALAERAAGTLLAPACGLPADEGFDEDDLYDAMDALTGHWCALEKGLAAESFKEPVSLVLYDLTSVYFEGAGPKGLGRYGHSRDHRGDRPQMTLQGFVKILRRRFEIREAVFAFDGGMSSKINLEALEKSGLKFVTRLCNATLEKLLTELPQDQQLELADADQLVEIVQGGKRHVVAGGAWRRQRDQERRAARIAKAEAALAKLAAVKRLKPNAQKIASQAGRTLLTLKAHKYFTYEVDAAGVLRWARKEEVIAAERAHDGWYLLHTNLIAAEASPAQVQGHYKNLLEVEEAFCELKSYLRVRPVFHWRPDRVINHVRLCFLAYWISARLATQWRACGETGEVTRLLRQLQTIRLGQLQMGDESAPTLARLTEVPPELNALLEKLQLLHLFATPPKWAAPKAP